MSVTRNVSANLVGNALVIAMSLLFVPVYVRNIGMEGFGLIAFHTSAQAVLSILDLGFAAVMTRQMAHLSADAGSGPKMGETAKTIEAVYWMVGMAIVIAGVGASPTIAEQWLVLEKIGADEAALAVALTAVAIGTRWPTAVYGAGLNGLQRQVTWNAIRIGTETLRHGGAAAIVVWVSPTVTAFFLWQAAVGIVGTAVSASSFWASMPVSRSAVHTRFRAVGEWRAFAAGNIALSLTSLLLLQADKLLLSRSLTLVEFGSYMLAVTVAMALLHVATAFYQAIYPKLTAFIASGQQDAATQLYHQATRALCALVVPAGFTLMFFPFDVLHGWTGSVQVAQAASPYLTILAIGSTANAILNVPFALQMAHGWTSLAVAVNTCGALLMLPILVYGIPDYGAMLAAWMWALFNLSQFLVSVPLMHRKILRGELGRWYVRTLAPTLGACTLAAVALKIMMPEPHLNRLGAAGVSFLSVSVLLACAIVIWPDIRSVVMERLRRLTRSATP